MNSKTSCNTSNNEPKPSVCLHFSHGFLNSICSSRTPYLLEGELSLEPNRSKRPFGFSKDKSSTYTTGLVLCEIDKREASFTQNLHNFNCKQF